MTYDHTRANSPDVGINGELRIHELITGGFALRKENRFSEAINSLSSAVSALRARMGDCLAEEGRHDDALALYCRILADEPGQQDALIGAGVVSLIKNDYRGARFYFHRALEADGGNSRANSGYGMALSMSGEAEEGRAFLKKALAADPENPAALHELVKSAYSLDLYADTAGHVATYLVRHPGDLDMLFTLAGLLYKAGNYDGAMERLEGLLALSQDYPGGRELMEMISAAQSERPGKTAPFGPPSPSTANQPNRAPRADASVLEGKRLKSEAKYSEALDAFRIAAELGERTVIAEMADCLANLGKNDRAALLYWEALLEDPGDVRALVGMGVLFLLAADTREAVSCFEKALDAEPSNRRALSGLGMARNAQGDTAGALECFAGALDVDPEDLGSLHECVKCAYTLGSFDEAEKHLETYLLYHPGDLDIRFSLAGIRFKAEKFPEARDDMEKVLMFSPDYDGGKELFEKINERLCA